MLTAQAGFGTAFATLFQPILDEASLTSKHPEAAATLRNIASYQELMSELRDAIQPELELIDSRVVAPLREYQELLKKVRKTITKRDHKVRVLLTRTGGEEEEGAHGSATTQLVDYDRFNNSYTKLKDKKEKSLSDEKNLFKLEQDLEQATQEYDHYNKCVAAHEVAVTGRSHRSLSLSPARSRAKSLTSSSSRRRSSLPSFRPSTSSRSESSVSSFACCPLLPVLTRLSLTDTLLEKMQGWGSQQYGDMSVEGIEAMHYERIGDTVEQLDALTITKRFAGTGTPPPFSGLLAR